MSKRELRGREKLCARVYLRLFGSAGTPMKQIKLSGRETAVLRAIDYSTGNTGEEIRERTQLAPEDLADILHGLCDVGYIECFPSADQITENNYAELRFEINPSYALDLKEAMKRR